MNRDARDELIKLLEGLASELEAAPARTSAAAEEAYETAKADGRVVSTSMVFARQAGALESVCTSSGIRLRAAIDVYLKGKR